MRHGPLKIHKFGNKKDCCGTFSLIREVQCLLLWFDPLQSSSTSTLHSPSDPSLRSPTRTVGHDISVSMRHSERNPENTGGTGEVGPTVPPETFDFRVTVELRRPPPSTTIMCLFTLDGPFNPHVYDICVLTQDLLLRSPLSGPPDLLSHRPYSLMSELVLNLQ